mmetsp:Transcript_39322/g.103734  ORF Transcript_39322/g.103734 Transcript_39322/m.103734 type:complete len:303 (+) Transcript_39322:309-1217(+)
MEGGSGSLARGGRRAAAIRSPVSCPIRRSPLPSTLLSLPPPLQRAARTAPARSTCTTWSPTNSRMSFGRNSSDRRRTAWGRRTPPTTCSARLRQTRSWAAAAARVEAARAARAAAWTWPRCRPCWAVWVALVAWAWAAGLRLTCSVRRRKTNKMLWRRMPERLKAAWMARRINGSRRASTVRARSSCALHWRSQRPRRMSRWCSRPGSSRLLSRARSCTTARPLGRSPSTTALGASLRKVPSYSFSSHLPRTRSGIAWRVECDVSAASFRWARLCYAAPSRAACLHAGPELILSIHTRSKQA